MAAHDGSAVRQRSTYYYLPTLIGNNSDMFAHFSIFERNHQVIQLLKNQLLFDLEPTHTGALYEKDQLFDFYNRLLFSY